MPFDAGPKEAEAPTYAIPMRYAERILRLANTIERSPTYNQGTWVHPCGSPACIAGHATSQCNMEHNNALPLTNPHIAEAYMGLSVTSAHYMFSGAPLVMTRGRMPTNKEAAAVLRNYVSTGVVDWYKASQ